jgi:hypothetical protein
VGALLHYSASVHLRRALTADRGYRLAGTRLGVGREDAAQGARDVSVGTDHCNPLPASG